MFLRRRNREQRENVLGELVLTEREYGRDLKLTWQVVTLIIRRIISSVRSSNSHTDLLLTQQHHHPTFSDHTGPQHWTFTF